LLEMELVVVLVVHEHGTGAVLVEILHLAFVQVGLLDLVLGTHAVDRDGTGVQVLQFELQNGPPVSGRIQIAVDDRIELAVLPYDHHAFADLAVFDGSHKYLRNAFEESRRCPPGQRIQPSIYQEPGVARRVNGGFAAALPLVATGSQALPGNEISAAERNPEW